MEKPRPYNKSGLVKTNSINILRTRTTKPFRLYKLFELFYNSKMNTNRQSKGTSKTYAL